MTNPLFATALTGADGLLAGLFVGSSMVEHAARTLNAPAWIAYKQAKEAVFAPVMPPVFAACLLATVAGAIILPTHVPLGVAAVLLAAVFVITAKVHLPLNALFQSWTETDYPVTWEMGRDRWRRWNLVRAGLVVLAFGFVLGGR